MARQKTSSSREHLRLGDLMNRESSTSRLMNVKVPAVTLDAIDSLALSTGASKTEVVIALLNEGLEALKQLKK